MCSLAIELFPGQQNDAILPSPLSELVPPFFLIALISHCCYSASLSVLLSGLWRTGDDEKSISDLATEESLI